MVFLAAPLASQSPDLARRDARLDFGPLGGLRNAVALAEHVVLPLVEAGGPFGDVVLVVEVFGQPGVGDAQAEGHVGAEPRREPLVGEEAGRVVEARVDKHHLDAELFHPEAPRRALEGGVDATAGNLGVGRPEDHHLGVLEGVFEQVVLLGDAQAVAVAPHVHAAPVPALPAIRVVLAVRVADQVHEPEVRAVPVAHVAPQVMGTGRGQYGRRADFAVQTDDLVADDVERLVPADRLVSGDTAILDVALALGVEVHPLERREDPLGRIDHGLLRHRMRRQGRAPGGLKSRPRAWMVQPSGSFSSRSMGIMRTILPSSTSTNMGPPVVQFVNLSTFPIVFRPPLAFVDCGYVRFTVRLWDRALTVYAPSVRPTPEKKVPGHSI